jgi:hypothetical protein
MGRFVFERLGVFEARGPTVADRCTSCPAFGARRGVVRRPDPFRCGVDCGVCRVERSVVRGEVPVRVGELLLGVVLMRFRRGEGPTARIRWDLCPWADPAPAR